jgi:pimeloyl-ACP methyl ester carboxylesterase
VDAVLRTDVSFRSDGAACAAWLYRPAAANALVVMAHGLSATRDQRLPAFAERFAAAGIGVLLFDYRGFGASGGEPRQVADIGAQLDDWRAAIAFARAQPGVRQVALFGSSFSGGHVLQLASEDPGLAAVIAQCPMADGLLATLKVPPLTSLKLAVAALQDQGRALAGRSPKLVPAVAQPGEVALMSSPDAVSGFASLTEEGSPWRNELAARVGLRIGLYRPGRNASKIAAPLLVCICDEDALVSNKAAARAAKAAPRGEARHYPVGHFDIYTGQWFERVVADETDFLVSHLEVARARSPA